MKWLLLVGKKVLNGSPSSWEQAAETGVIIVKDHKCGASKK